jgi:hypothetical protein
VRRGRTRIDDIDASNAGRRRRSHTVVRGLAVAVVSSVVVHAGALAWIASTENGAPPVAVIAAPPPPSATPPDPDRPLEITFFSYAGNAGAGSPVAASSPGEAAPAKRRLSTGGGTTASTETPGSSGTPGPRSPYMTMRHPGKEPLKGLSGKFFEEFMKNTKRLPPPDNVPGERIGNEIAELRAQLRRAERYSPDQLAALRARIVALNAEREAEELKPAGGGTYKTEKETFRAKVNADGSVKLEDKPENMDSQDRLMLRHGIDPYAKNKLAYLERTLEQRVAIGKRWRKEQLKKSVIYMQQHVARLFATTSDPAKRKQGLFELWDECTETGTPDELAGGEAARAFVMGVIRTKVKYTPDELRALNARRHSKQDFAP